MGRYSTNYLALGILIMIAGFVCALALLTSTPNDNAEIKPATPTVTIGSTNLFVPSWQLFHTGAMWSLISSAHKLNLSYVPDLVDSPVASAGGPAKVARSIAVPLQSLSVAANNAGIKLMLSSAYRSATDQQATYDLYLRLRGTDYVHSYVAKPGASEHQTGLAVDFATASSACVAKSEACSLDYPSTTWLRTYGPQYGFIERYPSGKQSITGIAGEAWHYRYVGVPLAKALTQAGMTLDEFVSQTAPGYSR